MEAPFGGDEVRLLEREPELARLEGALERVVAGEGRRVLIEGPAGIGKSALLAAACRRGSQLGMQLLTAEASELSANVALGVTRDLVGPASWEDIGAASARGEPQAVAARVAQGIIERASVAPVLVAVDDVHWSDPGSLRAMVELRRHLSRAPVALVLAARPVPAAERGPLLTTLLDDRSAVLLKPPALTLAAIGELLDADLEWSPGPELVAAVGEATGGNAYLVRAMADALHQAGPSVNGQPNAWVERVGAAAVAPSVERRLAELDGAGRRLIETVATVGDVGGLLELAQIAGIDPAEAADAAKRAVGADLLRADEPTRTAHPLVRAAITASIPAELRERLLRTAAELLVERGQIEDAAAHLLELPPRHDPKVAESLADAATLAMGRGSPEVAARLLRRALAEPPGAERTAEMRAALGTALLATGDPEAITVLRAALGEDPDRAETAVALALALVFSLRVEEACATLESTADRLAASAPAFAEELRAKAIHYAAQDPELRRRRRAELERDTERRTSELAHRIRLAERSSESLGSSAPAAETQALAERAVAGGTLLSGELGAFLAATLILAYTGRTDLAATLAQDAIAATRERGELAMLRFALGVQGEVHWHAGDLVATETSLRAALELVPERELGPPFIVRPLVETLLERGEIAAAEAELRRAGMAGEVPDVLTRGAVLYARGRLRAAAGAFREAVDSLLLAGESLRRFGVDTPAAVPWRGAAALTLLELGERAEALKLAEAQVELAERIGAPEVLGPAVRVHGLTVGGAPGLAQLERAVELLAGSRARLEHARALVDCGAALAAAGEAERARALLRDGAGLASHLGATVLAERATAELVAAGGRPRRAEARGAGALTPAERRVASLAAQGMSNRQIAETFVLATKTIESHLAGAYRKLGISGRAELANALSAVEDPVPQGPNG